MAHKPVKLRILGNWYFDNLDFNNCKLVICIRTTYIPNMLSLNLELKFIQLEEKFAPTLDTYYVFKKRKVGRRIYRSIVASFETGLIKHGEEQFNLFTSTVGRHKAIVAKLNQT